MESRSFDLSKVNTVLFDLDGTLVDTNGLIADTWRYTAKMMNGRDFTDKEIRETLGEPLWDSMRRIFPDADPEIAIEIYRTYQRERLLERIEPFEGVEETLRFLSESGYKMGIVTSRMRNSTERILEHLGLGGFFGEVLTASDTEIFKPDPAPIHSMLDMLGSVPEEAIYIGDTAHDILCGLAAGVFTVLVDWSYALPPEARAGVPTPDAVIGKMSDLLVLLAGD